MHSKVMKGKVCGVCVCVQVFVWAICSTLDGGRKMCENSLACLVDLEYGFTLVDSFVDTAGVSYKAVGDFFFCCIVRIVNAFLHTINIGMIWNYGGKSKQ